MNSNWPGDSALQFVPMSHCSRIGTGSSNSPRSAKQSRKLRRVGHLGWHVKGWLEMEVAQAMVLKGTGAIRFEHRNTHSSMAEVTYTHKVG